MPGPALRQNCPEGLCEGFGTIRPATILPQREGQPVGIQSARMTLAEVLPERGDVALYLVARLSTECCKLLHGLETALGLRSDVRRRPKPGVAGSRASSHRSPARVEKRGIDHGTAPPRSQTVCGGRLAFKVLVSRRPLGAAPGIVGGA